MIGKLVSKIRGSKFPSLCYMTYVLSFPDGEQWVKQTEFSGHDLDMMLKNMIAEHAKAKNGSGYDWKNRAMALWKVGECWWKQKIDEGQYIEHLILIEMKKRPKHQLKWGVSKANMIDVQTGVDEFGKKAS